MALRKPTVLHCYLAIVSICGISAAVLLVAGNLAVELPKVTPAVMLLCLLVVVGEMCPIRVPFRDDSEEVTTSTAFMFATLLLVGPAVTIIAQTTAALLSDLRARKPWWRSLFNVAQYSLSIGAAWLVLCAVDPAHQMRLTDDLSGLHLAAIVASGVTFFLLNNLFVVTALAIAQHEPVFRQLHDEFGFHTATTMVLLAEGPVVALAASRSIMWVLLFIPGMLAVYWSASISVEKERIATHDSLTGLLNRLSFHDRVGHLISDNAKEHVVVVLADLDGFKEVNDTLGHHIGDQLLRQVADQLYDGLPNTALVARLGGDEFAIACPVDTAGEADTTARTILELFRRPLELRDLPFHIEASIGAALYPEHGDTVDMLLQHADVAMYVAKDGRIGHQIYNPDQDRYSPRRLALLNELRDAITERQLVLHYQPIADLKTGAITHVEALVRWQHPLHGMIPPDEFIPLAEPTGMIGPLTTYVIDEALSQVRAWRDDGLDVTVAVNISTRNLHGPLLAEAIAGHLATWDLPPSALELEITESFLMADPPRAAAMLQSLNTLGIEISLDDFGTGYSSLSYLKRLPVGKLKIDRSFVMNMATDDDDLAIVASTVHLARSLGLRVVAEGVESANVWHQLRELGVDHAQGYYLSRPVPPEQLTRWLRQQQAGASAGEAEVRPLRSVPSPECAAG